MLPDELASNNELVVGQYLNTRVFSYQVVYFKNYSPTSSSFDEVTALLKCLPKLLVIGELMRGISDSIIVKLVAKFSVCWVQVHFGTNTRKKVFKWNIDRKADLDTADTSTYNSSI